jgi:catechol 2,3-dioxygenase-like lactoylglutathione lyase family enzyme
MPLEKAIPILAFLDLKESVDFYRALGFTADDKWGNYLICSRDHIEIHLWKCDDPEIPKQTGCYVRVTDVQAVYEECQKLGVVHPNGPLENKPWGIRQFSILDNSGNIIHFGEYIV